MSRLWMYTPEFWQAVQARKKDGQRHGQAVFNTAYEIWPRETDSLRGSIRDPFYKDEKVRDFLVTLTQQVTESNK